MLLFLLLVLIFLIPGVQTYTAKQIANNLNNKYNTQINIDRIKVNINADIKLEGALVIDHKQDTLFFAESLSSSIFNVSNLISSKNLDLSSTDIEGLKFNLIQYKDEKSDNLTQLLNKLDNQNAKNNNQDPFNLHIDDILLLNSEVNIIDYNKSTPQIFSISNLGLDLEDINVVDGDMSININTLSGLTGYGLTIERLKSKFYMSSTEMRFDNLELITPNSDIKTDLKFSFNKGDWADFEEKVRITAKFNNDIISTSDLKYFYDEFGTYERLRLNGDLDGTLNNFDLKNANIFGIQRSQIKGDIQFYNVTDAEKFTLNTQYVDISTNYFDLKRLLPDILGENLPPFIQYAGNFNVKGKIFLKSRDLEADLNVTSTVGDGDIELKFEDLNLDGEVKYEGKVNLNSLNIGKLSQSKKLGFSSFNVYVKGKGFRAESLDTEVKGKIKKIDINGYNYTGINIDGNLKYPIFDGILKSLDPNFLFDFEGVVDASKAQNTFKFKSNIKYADLYKLNFIKKDTLSIFKGNLDIDMKANTIDNAVGKISFENFSYKNSFDNYEFDDFVIESSIEGLNQEITVNSPDVITGRLYGNFQLSSLMEFVDVSLRNLYFKNIVDKKFENKNINFEFQINNKVVEAFFPKISIAPNTFLNGRISSNEDEMKMRFVSPAIRYLDNILEGVEIQLDKKNPYFDTYIEIANAQNAIYPMSKINLINVKLNDTLFFRTEFEGGKNNQDNYKFSFYQTYDQEENTVVGIQRSELYFKNKTWEINKQKLGNNKIVLEPGLQNFVFDSIMLTHKDHLVALNGVMKDSTYKDINLKLKEVELSNITPYIDSLNLNGLVNGEMNIYQKGNIYKPNLNVLIRNFAVNDVNYGNLKLDADGNKDLSDFDIKAYLSDQQKNYINAKGKITTRSGQQFIDVDASLNNLDISSLSPLGEDIINRLRGEVIGNAKIKGPLNNPDLYGALYLKNAGLKFPYLNVDFDFEPNARVSLDKKKFVFENISFTDVKYKTTGVLSGFISHERFIDWNLDLNINADNTLTLDTAFDDESLYYGTAFVSGNASITGPTDELVIDVKARSMPNTVFNIPLSDTETIGDSSFIYFLTPEDKKKLFEGKSYAFEDISGLTLAFDLTVTDDALVEVVVDQESGSALRGRGNGNIKLEITTTGKFDMYGDFNAQSGEYIYRYQGLVEKKLDVEPGGYITWDGDPLDAFIDIKAKYRAFANPAVLLENPSINREIPIDVFILLQGQLMQPDIRFNIEYPNLSSIIKSELDFRIQGQENQQRQALSLLVQGSFFNDEGLGINALGSNLLAERATSILDQILKDDDGEFNIGFDYVQAERTPNQNAVGSDRVGMKLQTQLSDKIFINGRFGVPVGGETQSFVFGDVELNFLLNESGSLSAQMFNRESNIQFIGEELGYAQGIGLTYSVDFETFGELIRKMLNRNKKIENTKGNNNNADKSESLVPDYIKMPNKSSLP